MHWWGKACIVPDARKALQRRTSGGNEEGMHPTVADAYVDCTSSESGSVAAVINNAYRKLYECCQLSSSSGYGKVQVKGNAKASEKGKHAAEIAQATLGGDDFVADFESEAEDEDADTEDLIEQQRKQRSGNLMASKRTKK